MLYKASFRITGLSSLLMSNPMGMAGGTGDGVSSRKRESAEEEAKKRLYANPDGTLYVPSMWFRAAMVNACTGRKLGKLSAKTVLNAAVFTTTDRVPLLDPATDEPIRRYQVNIARAVVQRAGVMRARPEIPQWSCVIEFEVDGDFISDAAIIGELLGIAGKIAGVGDWRPNKNGSHGRFTAELVSPGEAPVAKRRKIA